MITIGATGHRFLNDLERLRFGIEKALSRIEDAKPGETLTVLSSLAEGADRLVATQVLKRPGARLIVPLPLAVDEYANDFESGKSKEEFEHLLARAAEVIQLHPIPNRDEAYEAAGLYVIDHCDVLVAVWDGQDAQGGGGTAEIVAEARRRRLPLAWVHAGNRKSDRRESTSLVEEQGLLTFENLRGLVRFV